jgi:hypothetical protein
MGKPTKPGVYWVRAKGKKLNTLVRIEQFNGDLIITDGFVKNAPFAVKSIQRYKRIKDRAGD